MRNRILLSQLVMLGVGQVAREVAELASQYKIVGTTRDVNKTDVLRSSGITPFVIESTCWDRKKDDLSNYISGSNVLVSFPPDGHSDAMFSALCTKANAIIYISSTAVYGSHSGIVDESTPVEGRGDGNKLRLEAEQIWLEKGAIILRAPGLYGSNSGLHVRLRNGSYLLPPENNNYLSRIYLKDLARIVLAAFAKPLSAGSVYLVGDLEPAPQIEIVQWLCTKLNLPLPASAALDAASTTLTTNRRIDGSKILAELNIELEFPTYKEGYSDCLQDSFKIVPSVQELDGGSTYE